MVFLYRINGDQVVGVSTQTITGHDPTYFAVVTDPVLPDGADLVPAKIFVSGTVRNATAPEIANFATAEVADETLIARQSVKDQINVGTVSRKILQAIVELVVDELNILRDDVIGIASQTWDPASMANATGVTSPNFTVTGAASVISSIQLRPIRWSESRRRHT